MKTDAGLTYIGTVRSGLKTLAQCPRQGYEGAPIKLCQLQCVKALSKCRA